ncbi:MAG TPA: mechanosensitive ion channel family protein, partial [Terriglobia bacterium]|nr:mechanosensitive ion channel family protein [Terriglobia bacterium]
MIQFLQQTIAWYHQAGAERLFAGDPNADATLSRNHELATEIVQLAFDFARAQTSSKTSPAGPSQEATADSSRYQALLQLSKKLDRDVHELQGEIEAVRQKLAAATGPERPALQANLAETQSELDLANARRDAVRSMADFVGGADVNAQGATGLRAQIEALARTVPEVVPERVNGQEGGSSPSQQLNRPAASMPRAPEPSGILGLATDLWTLSSRVRAAGQAIQLTDALAQTTNELQKPLVDTLRDLSRRGDDLAKQADSAGPSELAQEKHDLDGLTAQFRRTAAIALPLSKQAVLLRLYKNSLTDWQGGATSQYDSELKSLLVRIAFLGVILGVAVGFGELSRRAVLRYIHDGRRRYQILLLRKIVLWFSVAVIIAVAFANQLGSVATFAGLITAGVAVALQSLILSIAGYFFLIGKFGIRVGDRVQIAGVTGEVVDVGLIRLHVMELGGAGAETPTGRVVAFPNSVVFQATAGLFKQIPGTNFAWHEITVSLSSDTDYGAAEERVSEAVEAAFSQYREELERQRRQMQRTF